MKKFYVWSDQAWDDGNLLEAFLLPIKMPKVTRANQRQRMQFKAAMMSLEGNEQRFTIWKNGKPVRIK